MDRYPHHAGCLVKIFTRPKHLTFVIVLRRDLGLILRKILGMLRQIFLWVFGALLGVMGKGQDAIQWPSLIQEAALHQLHQVGIEAIKAKAETQEAAR